MPIYAYKCASCGHAKDVLQKMSDAPLTECPACGASAFEKQLTAAGFQLKGSGWYATDFRNGSKPQAKDAKPDDAKAGEAKPETAKTETAKSDAPAPATTETKSASTPAPRAAPATET